MNIIQMISRQHVKRTFRMDMPTTTKADTKADTKALAATWHTAQRNWNKDNGPVERTVKAGEELYFASLFLIEALEAEVIALQKVAYAVGPVLAEHGSEDDYCQALGDAFDAYQDGACASHPTRGPSPSTPRMWPHDPPRRAGAGDPYRLPRLPPVLARDPHPHIATTNPIAGSVKPDVWL
jgi:hypothetical protein